MSLARLIWFSVGFSSLLTGILGIVLPVLPTTPFLLLSAYAFSRSSNRWHQWLVQHRALGPFIENWNRHGAIERRVKVIGIFSMILVFGLSWALTLPFYVLVIQAVMLSLCAIFVATRPAPPAGSFHQ